jgi:hypothetical protein
MTPLSLSTEGLNCQTASAKFTLFSIMPNVLLSFFAE